MLRPLYFSSEADPPQLWKASCSFPFRSPVPRLSSSAHRSLIVSRIQRLFTVSFSPTLYPSSRTRIYTYTIRSRNSSSSIAVAEQ